MPQKVPRKSNEQKRHENKKLGGRFVGFFLFRKRGKREEVWEEVSDKVAGGFQ